MLQYFHEKFSGELSGSIAAFKAARLVLVNLKHELPIYLAKAADLDRDADPLHAMVEEPLQRLAMLVCCC